MIGLIPVILNQLSCNIHIHNSMSNLTTTTIVQDKTAPKYGVWCIDIHDSCMKTRSETTTVVDENGDTTVYCDCHTCRDYLSPDETTPGSAKCKVWCIDIHDSCWKTRSETITIIDEDGDTTIYCDCHTCREYLFADACTIPWKPTQ